MRRAAIALAAVAATASCGPSDITVHAGPPPVAHENVGRANRNYPRPDVADPTLNLDRTLSTTPRASRSRTRPVTPPRSTPPAGSGDIWAALAQCESGMRPDAVGEGVHYSYFQWKLATWRSVKADTDPADPRDASYEQQVAAAQRLQARSGWGQWPACSRNLGLR